MPLPTSSLANICNVIREHVSTLGLSPTPADWEVTVSIGAPAANQSASNGRNTLNLFFYRFEPFGFAADSQPGDVQWLKIYCIITAFGVDEDTDNDSTVDFSAGFNELSMLSQVMRLFQEQPVLLIEGDTPEELWHTQFIARPLADDQINQIWSTQGETVYRPSIVYEIALAPIKPDKPKPQVARVASIGANAVSNINNRYARWPTDRQTQFPQVPSISVDLSNPQWAPAIMMITGLATNRQSDLSINLQVPNAGADADFSSFPQIELWVAGDPLKTGDLSLVGQLLQNPPDMNATLEWQNITPVSISADVETLDINNLPAPSTTNFTLTQAHWTAIDNTKNNWQLQLFAERYIKFDPDSGEWLDTTSSDAGVRIRSNPLLITLTRETS
jgi:hypothetical protein